MRCGDTPHGENVYAINYPWLLRITSLLWKKQTKLLECCALSKSRLLRLVINHIWRNIKGKGGNRLQHQEVRVSSDITHHWHQAESASSLMWQRLIFTSFGSRQFCSALRFLIIFRLCLIQSTQVRFGCENGTHIPSSSASHKTQNKWNSQTDKTAQR